MNSNELRAVFPSNNIISAQLNFLIFLYHDKIEFAELFFIKYSKSKIFTLTNLNLFAYGQLKLMWFA